MMIHKLALMIPLALSGQAPGTDAPKAEPPKAEPPKDAKPAANDPEAALRSFLIAMVGQDEAGLRAVAVPDPDLAILLKPSGPPLGALQKALARSMLAKAPIRALKVGDVVEIPTRGGKRKLTVGPDDVSETAAFLQVEGNPLPTRLRKIEGSWRVDASPIIAGRKAAEAARKAREGPKPPDEKPKP